MKLTAKLTIFVMLALSLDAFAQETKYDIQDVLCAQSKVLKTKVCLANSSWKFGEEVHSSARYIHIVNMQNRFADKFVEIKEELHPYGDFVVILQGYELELTSVNQVQKTWYSLELNPDYFDADGVAVGSIEIPAGKDESAKFRQVNTFNLPH